MTIHELSAKLEGFADLEGTESGEYAGLLCQLANYTYFMEPGFFASFEQEVNEQLNWFDQNYEIVQEGASSRGLRERNREDQDDGSTE